MSDPRLNAAYYAAPVAEFLSAADDEVYAPLASPQWRLQLPHLRAALEEFVDPAAPSLDPPNPAPWIHLEFDIPRLGRRVDAVLVNPSCVIHIEFNVGARKCERHDYEQAGD